MHRPIPSLLLALSLGWSAPALAADPACVVVDGPASANARAALADRGIATSVPTCTATLLLAANEEALTWTLTSPRNGVAVRTFDTIEDGAIWVDSMVHVQRIRPLLEADDLAPVDAIGSTPEPEPPANSPRAHLYPSFEAWRAGMSSAAINAAMSPRTVNARLVGEEGLEPMWALDRRPRDGRKAGPAFIIQVGDDVYVNETAPPAHREQHFGRLDRGGGAGVFQRRFCYWVPIGQAGIVQCDVHLRWIDLETGEVEPVSKRTLRARLADHPDLLSDFQAERRKHAGTLRRYALALLERMDGE